jgi:hypothetical protein
MAIVGEVSANFMLFKNSKHATFVFVRLIESQSLDYEKKDSSYVLHVMRKNESLHATCQ